MRISEIKWLIIFGMFAALPATSLSQTLAPDASAAPAFKNALAVYNNSFADQLHLFNGTEYRDYSRPFDEGQPYFVTNEWSKGMVNYDGNVYENVSILYNLVTDELIILNWKSTSKIQLIKEKVAGFSLANHTFLYITADSLFSTGMNEGFYDVLASGKTSLLVRRTKNIQPFNRRTLELKVFENNHYYIKKNDGYFSFHNKNTLLDQLRDKRKEMRQFIKQNDLGFNKEMEASAIKAVDYYNQLTK